MKAQLSAWDSPRPRWRSSDRGRKKLFRVVRKCRTIRLEWAFLWIGFRNSMTAKQYLRKGIAWCMVDQNIATLSMILKPNMVLPDSNFAIQATAHNAAEATVSSLLRVVPAAVPAIAFMSEANLLNLLQPCSMR